MGQNGTPPPAAAAGPRAPQVPDDEPEPGRVNLDGWTKVGNALPLLIAAHGLDGRQVAVLLTVLSVAGWGFRSKRYATIGCRSIAARLGHTMSARTALRVLQSLADGYVNGRGNRRDGCYLLRFVRRSDRKRSVIDLQPLLDELAHLYPEGDAPFRGPGRSPSSR